MTFPSSGSSYPKENIEDKLSDKKLEHTFPSLIAVATLSLDGLIAGVR
jgi:hypothetical protein